MLFSVRIVHDELTCAGVADIALYDDYVDWTATSTRRASALAAPRAVARLNR
jgi:hypothetical protein